MAYKLLKNLVAMGRKSKEELLDMADVYYGVGRITSEQYTELIGLINQVQPN